MCGFPKLIAACHVLHRLFLPRHPPCALSSLTIEFTRTHQESTPTVELSTLFSPPSVTCLHWIRVEGYENILKTLNTKLAFVCGKYPHSTS